MKIITTSNLNVRKGAGTNYSVVKTLPKGTTVTVIDQSGSWYNIGTNQWISSSYTKIAPNNTKNEIVVNPKMTMKQIQDCLKEKGCTIRFSAGVYYITQTLYLYSNTTIILDGATLIRKKKCYLLMTYVDSNTIKYNGEKDITISGGTIIGDGHNGITNLINIVHAQNITINKVTIKNNVGCHPIEINSSKNVTVENCTLDGNIIDIKNPYREAIQIDFAHAIGLAYISNKSAKTYDDTHCENITIRNNTFKGYNVVTGTHTQTKSNKKHIGIKIINNICVGIGAVGGYGSCFKIMNFKDVLIENNNISKFARGIEVISSNRFYSTNGVITKTKPSYITGSEDIIIRNNYIYNPSKDYKASGVYIDSKFDNLIHDNVLIENNTFKLNNGVSKYDIFYDKATNVKEKNNKSDV